MSRGKDFKQHAILCEGFDDRSFWAGWLFERLGCSDPTHGGKVSVEDAWGRLVRGRGRYFYRTPSGSGVILHPADGKTVLRDLASEYLGSKTRSYDRVLINYDSDADADPEDALASNLVRTIVDQHGGTEHGGRFKVGTTRVDAVVWRCDDPADARGVPRKQTLERLACAAIVEAYPDRASTVEDWLAAQPTAPVDEKNYSFSYLAKWYADHGADDYWRALWRDEAIAAALERRLDASGARSIVRELVTD